MDDVIILQESRPNRSDAIRNRDRLLETARQLFSQNGVENVSMNDIAKAAGVGKGTLYRHFENGKPQLCETLLDAGMRALQERTFAQLRANPNPVDMLVWLIGEVLVFVDHNAELLGSGMVTGIDFLVHPAHVWWRQTIYALLQRIDFSHQSTPPDLDYLADALYITLDIRTVLFQKAAHGWDIERIRTGAVSMLTRLIA